MLSRTMSVTRKVAPRGVRAMSSEFYPGIDKIKYEGSDSKNPLSFKHYQADEIILGKSMKEWWVSENWQS